MRTNATRQFRFRERNVHCVVVSFPGTKVHGKETSRYRVGYPDTESPTQTRTVDAWRFLCDSRASAFLTNTGSSFFRGKVNNHEILLDFSLLSYAAELISQHGCRGKCFACI